MTFKDWDRKPLRGTWLFTYKVDGFQCKREGDKVVSKNGKPLYNFPKRLKRFHIAEVFCGSWGETSSIVTASKSKRRQVRSDEIYLLYPIIDSRLQICAKGNPSAEFIQQVFERAVKLGYEGLVLRQGDTFIKVKTVYTIDIKVTGTVEGKGRLKGKLGKFTSDSGDCGVGLTDAQRAEYWERRNEFPGTYIEVECMEKTKKGKLRNPRFIRIRPDK